MIDFERARETMVDNQLRTSGITDRRILVAMSQVPRELFLPEVRHSLAYIDTAHVLPGGSGRALAAPAPFARLVQLADIGDDDAVLDVGVGTGYSAAILNRLAGSVVAVESDPDLAGAARANLAAIGAGTVLVVEGDLEAGAPKHGPYDVILVEGAVSEVPHKLLRQLKEGGKLVALIRRGASSVAHVFVRSGDDFAPRAEFNTSLPPLGVAPRAETFVF